jgi:DNA-binding SARP family transcriptional activator/class 3 adenylate cyclase
VPEIRAFLIADVRGYTRFTHERGDEAAARLTERFLDVARPTLDAHGGELLDQRGDEIAAVFVSCRDAVRASVELQDRLVEATLADPSLPLAVGIGLDAGEAVQLEHGYRGGALNLAARLCEQAAPGEVLSSEVIAHLARAIEGIEYAEHGSLTLKGLAEPVRVVRVSAAGTDAAARLALLVGEAAAPAARSGLVFRILGPLEVSAGGRPLPLGGTKQRAVLALLLTRAGEVVSRDRLIEELWVSEAPPTAVAIVQTYISHLRKEIGHDVLQTRPPGYAIELAGHELDLTRFEEHLAAARTAPPAVAAELLGQALALWRGPALADFAYEPFAQPEIARLEELRLVAIERRIDADLELGRHAELVGELDGLVEQHPLRERFRAQLMLALYRAGRQAEALEAYQHARRALVDELGIDPSPALQELEKAILRQDVSLAPVSSNSHTPAPSAPLDGLSEVPERSILVVPLEEANLDVLLGLAETLARQPPREIILARLVGDPDELSSAAARMRRRREELVARGLAARAAVFTSSDVGADIVLVAAEQPTDLLLLDAPPAVLETGEIEMPLAAVLADAPCDVGLLVARDAGVAVLAGRPVIVPFSGAEHDWSAIEIAAWISRALDVPLQLLGTTADPEAGRRDASRLLARASLMVQQLVGVDTEPLLVAPGGDALVEAAALGGLLVFGLSPRWRQEGIGSVRLAVARDAPAPTLLVRRGLRPGGIAPRESVTRFTWTLAAER